jgi:hypothetical protein
MYGRAIVICGLTILGALVVFVTAQAIDQDNIPVDVGVVKGWNLIANGIFAHPDFSIIDDNSDIQGEDIVAIYYYDTKDKKYYQVYPRDENDIVGTTRGYEIIEGDAPAAWIYSKKEGDLIFETDDIVPVDDRNVRRGWNLISITPDIVKLLLDRDYGSCNVERAYFWNSPYNDWMVFPLNNPESFTWDGDNVEGYGLVVKVSNDCSFGSVGAGGPPGLPGGSDTIRFSDYNVETNDNDIEEVCAKIKNDTVEICVDIKDSKTYRNGEKETVEVGVIEITKNINDYIDFLLESCVSKDGCKKNEDIYMDSVSKNIYWFYDESKLITTDQWGDQTGLLGSPIIQYYLDKYPPIDIGR